MCMAEMPDCARCDSGLEETALWDYVGVMVASISPNQLDVAYIIDNIDLRWAGMKQKLFLENLSGSNGDHDPIYF